MTGRDGKVVTFYSYKGGTGRTMALANVAWILASSGKRVLAVDWTWSPRACTASSTPSWISSWWPTPRA